MEALKPRLAAVAECVRPGGALADIGSDHGLLPLHLLKTGRISFAVITDISEGSLQKAIDMFAVCGYSPYADFRAGDGLGVLRPEEADTIVIAGMGGLEIIRILAGASQAFRSCRFVFQPMRNAPELRRFLAESGFRIVSDRIVRERMRFYPVICAEEGGERLSEEQMLLGKTGLVSPDADFAAYLAAEERKLRQLTERAQSSPAQADLLHKLKIVISARERIGKDI